MRILGVVPSGPIPPLSGGIRRVFEQYRYLAERHDVEVVTVATDSSEVAALKSWEGPGLRVHIVVSPNGIAHEFPLQGDGFYPERMATGVVARTARELVERGRFDVALAEHSFTWPAIRSLPIPRVLTAHNIESDILQQCRNAGGSLDLPFALAGEAATSLAYGMRYVDEVADFERTAWRQADAVSCVSPDELQRIQEHAQKVFLVENGYEAEFREAIGGRITIPPTFAFVGALNYLPNVDAVVHLIRDVLPTAKRAVSKLQVVVIGRAPSADFVAYCNKQSVRVIADPENAWESVPQAAVMVIPLRLGGGTRIKFLDSFSAGLPVVSTELAAAGLGLEHGEQVLIGNGPGAIAEAAVAILSDRALYAALTHNARLYLRENFHGWRDTFSGLDDCLTAVTSTAR